MLEEFFVELNNKELYDNTTIVIMADHAQIGYCQNPLFTIKNKDETHNFKVSNVATSYEYPSDIWVTVANGEDVKDDFISNCKSSRDYRRFLFYSWDNSWNREYLPGILEMLTYDVANNAEEMVYSGVQYEADAEDHSYSLGTQLSFTTEDTANKYCIFGFIPSEKWGTWTNGKQSTIEFNIKDEKYNNLLLTIESGTYHSQQEVIIDANNEKIADYYLIAEEILIPRQYNEGDKLNLRFELPDAISPKELGMSDDVRTLGLAMKDLTIEK